jgi:hypothetical protein
VNGVALGEVAQDRVPLRVREVEVFRDVLDRLGIHC